MSIDLMWEIRVFCAVADKHSFVAAARMLGRSPSAVTRALQALEQALGFELLQRNQQQVSFTAAGESYYGYAKHLLALQDEAEDELAGLGAAAQGWIRCTAPESLAQAFLPAVIAAFGRRHPDIHIDVRFTDDTVDPIRERLDFAIRGAFPLSSELIGYPLWSYRRHLYASPNYLALKGTPERPDELSGHELIMHTAPRILKDWNFVADDAQYRLKVLPRYRFNSGMAVLQAARQGAGIARLADWLAEPAVQEGSLVRVCPSYRVTSSSGQDPQMHVVYASPRLPRRVSLFLQAVREAAPKLE